MPETKLLATGEGEYRLDAPDTLRAWMRDRKRRAHAQRTTIPAEAVGRLGVEPGHPVIGRTARS
jgi:hypothetical protein